MPAKTTTNLGDLMIVARTEFFRQYRELSLQRSAAARAEEWEEWDSISEQQHTLVRNYELTRKNLLRYS